MSVFEPERADRLGDRLEVGPIDRDVHITGRAGGEGIAVGDMEKHRDATDHAIRDARDGERLRLGTTNDRTLS